MSDFGANIFDTDQPSSRQPKPPRAEPGRPHEPTGRAEAPREPRPAQPTPAEHVLEVPIDPMRRVHDDTREADFGDRGRARRQEHARDPRRDDRLPREGPREAGPRDAGPREHGSRGHGDRGEGRRRHEEHAPRREHSPYPDRRPQHEDRAAAAQIRGQVHEQASAEVRPRPEQNPTARPAAPAAARPAAGVRAVAVLVDLAALQAEAREQGGELAVHRLRTALAGDRTADRAVCFSPRGGTAPSGFDLTVAEDTAASGLQFAATALDLVAAAGQLVMAPPSAAIRQLATAMRKLGHKVELAGFVARSDDGQTSRRLGRDCLFVP